MYYFENDPTAPAAATKLVEKWTQIAFRTTSTTPEEKALVLKEVHNLYKASNLPLPPIITMVASPLFARALAGLLSCPDKPDTDPTKSPLHRAYHAALNGLPFQHQPEDHPSTPQYIRDQVRDIHAKAGLKAATEVVSIVQAGNEWAHRGSFVEFGRDHIKLDIDYTHYNSVENLNQLSGWRFVQDRFCIISDLPVSMHVTDNQLHNLTGPARAWADGFEIYAMNGIQIPKEWITDPASVDPLEVLREPNVEKRVLGFQLMGWARMLSHFEVKVIDESEDGLYPDNDMGSLIELKIPDLPTPGRFLRAVCPRNGIICEEVPNTPEIKTARDAQSWRRFGFVNPNYVHSHKRT